MRQLLKVQAYQSTKKMKKIKKPKVDQHEVDIFESIQQNPYFQWIVEKRNWLPYIFLALVVLFVLTFRFFSLQSSKTELDFIVAEKAFLEVKRSLTGEVDEQTRDKAIETLQHLIARYPELNSKYNGQIAQILITQGLNNKAENFVQKSSTNLSKDEDMAYYLIFSNISQLIGQQKYKEALDTALHLKDQLLKLPEDSKSDYDNLFAYNLLRIAILQKEAGNPESELSAWSEWKKYSESEKSPNKLAFNALKAIIEDDNFNLEKYIAIREKELTGEKEK